MQTFSLDFSVKKIIPLLHAKQGDVGRKFKVILTDSGSPYSVPAGATVSVWFSGASGEGNYTDIGAESAVSISSNEITVELITQMLTNPGAGVVCLVINASDGDELGVWNINYVVEPRPGMNSEEANAYFTAFSQAVANLPYPDASLTAAGKAADAAAVGVQLANLAAAITNGKTKVVKLWGSASGQTSSFAGEQMIDLGEGNTTAAYDCLVILCWYSTGLGYIAASPLLFSTYTTSVYFPKGFVGNQHTRWFRRDGGNQGRYVWVSHGYKDGAQDDSVCMPMAIFGIKW